MFPHRWRSLAGVAAAAASCLLLASCSSGSGSGGGGGSAAPSGCGAVVFQRGVPTGGVRGAQRSGDCERRVSLELASIKGVTSFGGPTPSALTAGKKYTIAVIDARRWGRV